MREDSLIFNRVINYDKTRVVHCRKIYYNDTRVGKGTEDSN